MNRYKLTFYNSGGYKDSDIIETTYEINRDFNDQLCVMDNDQVIGGDELIAEMIIESRGWIESYCVVDAERL